MRWIKISIVLLAIMGVYFMDTGTVSAEPAKNIEKATLAGGCFWCMEPPYEKLDGVIDAVSGYTDGHKKDPTYKEVSAGKTGHAEAVEITFDPSKVTYSQILDIFWMQINPTDAEGQFVDRGSQYRSAIFYHNEEQKKIAEQSKARMEKSGRYDKPIVTEIKEATRFYAAEEYHQDYYKKNPVRYKVYRYFSGRDKYLDEIWGKGRKIEKKTTGDWRTFVKPSKEELKKRLTPLQYKVTQKDDTERAFKNEYWDNKKEGIYVDIVSAEPLYSSTDKFKSGTGWPSFTKPLEPANVIEKEDRSFFT